MAGISVSGIGSGIDINSIVAQLVAAERDPKVQRLDAREARFQAELSGFGLVKSALSELQSALDGLDDPSLFQGRTATSAAPDVFTASAGAGTAPGTYAIEVEQLAVAQKLRTGGFTGADATVGTGSLTIAAGGESFTIAVAADGDSLAAIRDAINESTDNTIVNAGIVNVDDGAGGTESRLVLTAREPGSANALTVTVSGDGDGNDSDAAGLSQLVYDPDGAAVTHLVEVAAATDAIIRVDGQQATRATNTVDDVIDGITLDLLEADPGNTHTLTVAEDTAAATAAVNAFVTAFNEFISTQDGLTAFDAETRQSGPLLGDSTLRFLESDLRGIVSTRVSAAGDVDSLVVLGITTGADGRLAVDGEALGQALAANPTAVAELFTGEEGIVAQAHALVTDYLQSSGLLDNRIDGLNARIERIGDERLDLARRLEALESRLLAQFTAMDELVSGLQSTGNFLTQQLSRLPTPGGG